MAIKAWKKKILVSCENNITEIAIFGLSLIFLLVLDQSEFSLVKIICIFLSVLVVLRLIISVFPIENEHKLEMPNSPSLLSSLHKTTNRLIATTIQLVTMRTFLLFVVSLVVAIYVKKDDNSILNEFSDYIFALSTTLFTIWLVEIIYNSQVDDLNAQRIDQTLMKIFENRDWVRQMGQEWRETAISECLIGSFGEELGRKYAQKTIGSQLKQDTYRLSFDYVVSLKEERENESRLIQELSYKKRLNLESADKLDVSSVFEFEENRFYEPANKNEIVFFKEEIRSKILKSLLRYSCVIAKKIVDSKENFKNGELQFTKRFEDVVDYMCKDVVNSIIRNSRNSEAVARYRQLYDKNKNIVGGENLVEEGSELSDEVRQLHRDVYNTIKRVKANTDRVWYGVVGEIIADNNDISSVEKVCSDIVRLLINYKCTELDANGNLKQQEESGVGKVMFIIKKEDKTIADVEICDLNVDDLAEFYKIDVMGVKFVSKVNSFVENRGVYFYARMTCDYPIYNQNTFYWKFGEPMIGTSFLMSFPGTQDMDLVHAVQYFSDNHQSVTIDKGASTVSFYAEDLLLPESGIYIHWSKRKSNDNSSNVA